MSDSEKVIQIMDAMEEAIGEIKDIGVRYELRLVRDSLNDIVHNLQVSEAIGT
jgi:hypothetical protein